MAQQTSEGDLSDLRRRFMNAATVDRSGGARTTGVRWWLKYCVYGRSRSPFTNLGPHATLQQQVEAEQLLMDFCLWLATECPSGRPVSAKTIGKYVSQIRAWHLREFRTPICGDLDSKQLNDLLRGVCRLVQQPQPMRRWGVRTQDLSEAIRRYLSGPLREDAMWSAALQTAFCGLMRAAELALQDGESFDSVLHLTRADLKFKRAEDGTEYAVIMMRIAKGKPGAGKVTHQLILGGGGSMVDAVRALKRMVDADPVEPKHEASTPLFRRANGQAIRVAEVRAMVKLLMGLLGLDSRRFGAHSLRIGGATAAMAAGVPAAAIRIAGRWASDIYEIYTRCSRQAAARLAMVIGSTSFEDLEREQFINEELTLTSTERPPMQATAFVERELIEDAVR